MYDLSLDFIFSSKLNLHYADKLKEMQFFYAQNIENKWTVSTCYICVRFPARNPLASLKSPVIWISEYDIHKYIVVRSWVEARNVEA